MDISGYVVLGIVTLFLVYLMPQLIRSRQDVVDSRLADRFSADLRILAKAGAPGVGSRLPTDDGALRAYLHDPRLRTEVSAMNRPIARASRPVTPDSVNPAERGLPRQPALPERTLVQRPQAERAGEAGTPGATRGAARPEVAKARRAAARRRLALTIVLLGLSAWAWFSVAAAGAPLALAAVPTFLLGVVLVLGRRAAAAASRAAEAARRGSARSARPAATRPAATSRPAGSTRPAAPAPRGARPEASSRGSARPAGREARAAQGSAPRNVNAQPGSAQNGRTQVSKTGSTQSRLARETSTEIVPRVGSTEQTAGLRWSGEPTAPVASEVIAAPLDDGQVTVGADESLVFEDRSLEAAGDPSASEAAAIAETARAVGAPRAGVEPASARPWTPVPVPAPTYTLKPAAPRTTPAPLDAQAQIPATTDTPTVGSAATEEAETSSADAAQASGAAAGQGAQGASPSAVAAAAAAASAAVATAAAAGLDLDAVLNRRRASGE